MQIIGVQEAHTVNANQVAALNEQIHAGDSEVIGSLRDLPSRCVEDAELLTPFAAAIRSNNSAVITLLLEDDQALNYCPAFNDELASQIKMTLSGDLRGSLQDTEQFLLDNHYVEHHHWQRTPLLEACRCGNEKAIRLLVAAGADLSAEDVLGQRALDLCLHSRNDDTALALIDSTAKAGGQYPIGEEHLEATVRRPAVRDQLLQHGALNPKSKHFVFNLACALLDTNTVKRMLAAKYKPQRAVSYHKHPVIEAATSYSVFVYGLPEFSELAPGFAHMYGHPDAASISSADLFDEEGKPISFAKAEARMRKMNAAMKWKDKDPKFVPDTHLQKRLALLDLLADAGIEPGKYGDNPIEKVTATNRPELLARLHDFGFETKKIAKSDIKHAMAYNCLTMAAALRVQREKAPKLVQTPEATWELPVESGISARFTALPAPGKPASLEIVFDNSYCPLDGLQLYARIGDPDTATAADGFASIDDWSAPVLKRETVYLDDNDVPRSEVQEPLSQEAPWEAHYAIDLVLLPGANRIEIAVVSEEIEELNGVFSDWIVNVPDSAAAPKTRSRIDR